MLLDIYKSNRLDRTVINNFDETFRLVEAL